MAKLGEDIIGTSALPAFSKLIMRTRSASPHLKIEWAMP